MKDHNTRAQAMWKLIEPAVDFKKKRVLDLGCGYGDFLWRASHAGAAQVVGVDQNPELIGQIASWSKTWRLIYPRIWDINDWPISYPGTFDITFCFSVLPYLKDFRGVVNKIRTSTHIALFECQYFGDGPGLEFIKTDEDMRQILSWAGFAEIRKLGFTLVEGRNKERSIWLCQN